MIAPRTRVFPIAAALTAFATLSCGGDISGLSTGPADGITSDIGITVRDEVEGALSALTLGTSLDPIGTTQAAGVSSSIAFSILPCVNPSSAADSDGDGVPDDATYVFTAPPCRFTGWRGGTLDVVGQLNIQDPTPTAAGFGYEATLTELRSRFTTAGNEVIYDVTRNGTRNVSGSTASLLLTADLQLDRTFVGHPDAKIATKWAVTYTPASQLLINGELPSGSLDITGTLGWTRADEAFALTITTPAALQYDASCTDTVQRLKAGELKVAGKFDGTDGFLRVRWTGCGQEPSYSFETTG